MSGGALQERIPGEENGWARALQVVAALLLAIFAYVYVGYLWSYLTNGASSIKPLDAGSTGFDLPFHWSKLFNNFNALIPRAIIALGVGSFINYIVRRGRRSRWSGTWVGMFYLAAAIIAFCSMIYNAMWVPLAMGKMDFGFFFILANTFKQTVTAFGHVLFAFGFFLIVGLAKSVFEQPRASSRKLEQLQTSHKTLEVYAQAARIGGWMLVALGIFYIVEHLALRYVPGQAQFYPKWFMTSGSIPELFPLLITAATAIITGLIVLAIPAYLRSVDVGQREAARGGKRLSSLLLILALIGGVSFFRIYLLYPISSFSQTGHWPGNIVTMVLNGAIPALAGILITVGLAVSVLKLRKFINDVPG